MNHGYKHLHYLAQEYYWLGHFLIGFISRVLYQMPKQPFVLTLNILTSVYSFTKFQMHQQDQLWYKFRNFALSMLFRSGAESWLEQVTGATGADQPTRLWKMSKVRVLQSALGWPDWLQIEIWCCSFKTLQSCSSLTGPWILENYYWRSGKEAEKCYAPVEGESSDLSVFHFDPKPTGRITQKGVQQAHASLRGKLGWSLLMGLCMHLGYDLICAADTCLANTRAGRGCRWLLMVILQHKVRWFCCPCSAWLVLYSLLVLLLPPSSFLFLFSVAFPADSWHTLLWFWTLLITKFIVMQ